MTIRLMALRKQAGYKSRDAFAESIGVNRHTYKSWETGKVPMNTDQLLMIADALDCSCDAILGREVRQDYDDPMERELHKVWRGLDVERRERLLSDARDMAVAQALGDTPAATGSPGAISA